jgi:outer membrane protein
MKTNARLTSGATVRTARVKIDPIVAGMGIGFRF